MAAGLQGGTALKFSVKIQNASGGSVPTYGIIQSLSVNSTTERAEAKGPDGHTVSVQEYDNRHELSLSYLEKASPTGAPAIGSTFTFDPGTGVGSQAWYINSVNVGETVDGFRTVDITATDYPNLGV